MGSQVTEGQDCLIEKVINQGICVQCGACVGLCPYFDYFDGKVVVMDQCRSDTWRCLQLCPRADFKATLPDPAGPAEVSKGEIGGYREIMMLRSVQEEIRKKAQYGGVVSSLLIYAMEKKHIQSAVLTDADNDFSPCGVIAGNSTEVLNCAGSRYSGSAALSALNRAIGAGEDRIGVVGLPCQMEALARMRLMQPDGEERSSRVSLKIGLFCTWAVSYRRLEAFLKIDTILKYDIPPPPAEKFRVLTESGWRDFPLQSIRPFIEKGCLLCEDMTAERADISVGMVEGCEEWNTVVVRTNKGMELVKSAIEAGRLEQEPLPSDAMAHLAEAARNKRERVMKAKTE